MRNNIIPFSISILYGGFKCLLTIFTFISQLLTRLGKIRYNTVKLKNDKRQGPQYDAKLLTLFVDLMKFSPNTWDILKYDPNTL